MVMGTKGGESSKHHKLKYDATKVRAKRPTLRTQKYRRQVKEKV